MRHIRLFEIGCGLLLCFALHAGGAEFFVAVDGNDGHPGTATKPFRTVAAARDAAHAVKLEPVTVLIKPGTYYLADTLVFAPDDSRTEKAPLVFQALPGGQVCLSGGAPLDVAWKPAGEINGVDGIWKARVPEAFYTDQLFLNGRLLPMARYPDYDPDVARYNGFATDAISDEKVAEWSDPAGGFFHVLHKAQWGGTHYRITGKDEDGKLIMEGGWQNARGKARHGHYRFVENIFEELDAPREWYLNTEEDMLYFYPPAGVDPNQADFEMVRLKTLIEMKGSAETPIRFIRFEGLTFRHAKRTFMETKAIPSRSDWAIGRIAALLFEGVEDCVIKDCVLEDLGGNAVFFNHYARRVSVLGTHIRRIGASGICFVGDPAAQPGLERGFKTVFDYDAMDREPGPRTPDYPLNGLVEDCLIHDIGRVEKQPAGVQIDLARNITIRHCSIYDCPRAGINIGSGAWSGHLIEYCDVFDTVLETKDHGAFNAWGRDRYWTGRNPKRVNYGVGKYPELPFADAMTPTIIRNNRWRCDHGWDIDPDDGCSNYRIYNNLCLAGGIKVPDGYRRRVENNITVNDTIIGHKWYYSNSCDVVRRNIVFDRYELDNWYDKTNIGRNEVDYNLLHKPDAEPEPARMLQDLTGMDKHSLVGDAMFVDPASGDYRVKEGSPALKLGFENFPMDRFGVKKPALKRQARTPKLPSGGRAPRSVSLRSKQVVTWLGAEIRNVVGMSDVSSLGLFDETGVMLVEVADDSAAAKVGLHKNDAILAINEKPIDSVDELMKMYKAVKENRVALKVWRGQETIRIEGDMR